MTTYNSDGFFSRHESDLMLAFDDVLVAPAKSACAPNQVSVTSSFSRNVPLKAPIVSAAMDTVSEWRLAIAMAQNGGLSVIHRNLTPEEQGAQVRRVKTHLNGLIENPVTVRESELVREILQRCRELDIQYRSFPVLSDDGSGRIVGIITSRDFAFCADDALRASDIMSNNLISAPAETTIEQAYRIMMAAKKKAVPLINAAGTLAGMYVLSDVKRLLSGSNQAFNVDRNGRLRVAAAVGVGQSALDRLSHFPPDIDAIVIDTAHAHSLAVLETLQEMKRSNVRADIVVGNVCEPQAVRDLLSAGADGIKVGIGPGSICTTRVVAGIGCPQFSAIYHCAKEARGSGIPICGDGGIKQSGDITKAIAAGAHCVMIGSLLAGTDEAPGELIETPNGRMKKYRGMGSIGAMQKRGGRDRYGQGDIPTGKLVPEGIEGGVPYSGSLAGKLHQLLGGLRAGMGYAGAPSIAALQESAAFHRVTSAGDRESHPHDVFITVDAPNYRR